MVIDFVLGGLCVFADARSDEMGEGQHIENWILIGIVRMRRGSGSLELCEDGAVYWAALAGYGFFLDEIVNDDTRHVAWV
jgi:hypothetical protein